MQILTYHRLSKEKKKKRYTITEKDFAEHISFLHKNNYQCILVDDYYKSILDGKLKKTNKNIIITFDDGHDSDFELALPILKRYKFKANFFITTDWIGKSGYMTAGQLRNLKKEGMSVQSHAKSHFFLDEMDNGEIHRELGESKERLESIIADKIKFLSFPGGRYNRSVVNAAKKFNYSALFSSHPFQFKKEGRLFLVGRSMMKYSKKGIDFEKIVQANKFFKLEVRMSYLGKYFLKKILGKNIYYSLWKRYMSDVKVK